MPNIDRNDKNATRYEPTPEEQIAHQRIRAEPYPFDIPMESAILASLKRLSAIDAVKVPEPVARIKMRIERRIKPDITVVEAHHYDKLVTMLQRETERAEGLTENQLAVACSHAGLDYSVFLKIKAYLPVAPTPAAIAREPLL